MREYVGVVVNTKDLAGIGRVQIRIPQIHGEVGKSPFIADEDLPWALVKRRPNTNPNAGNQYEVYTKGELVKVIFLDQEYEDIPGQQPLVVETLPKPDPKSTPTVVNTTNANPVNLVTVSYDKFKFSSTPQEFSPSQINTTGDNVSFAVSSGLSFNLFSPSPCGNPRIPLGYKIPDQSLDIADGKCGQQSKIKGTFAENIADFLGVISNDGRIGTKLISSYSGELFAVTSYVKKYTSSILGIFRDGLKWIKAIITKYIRQAIDELTKILILPVKGILDPVQGILEDALNQVGCTLGDIEKTIQNLIEDLLNALIDVGLNAVFGCLDTLVDGIINEIISQVSDLINLVIGGISSIAGIIGGLGDIAGEALGAVLDFLGISCGGVGDCTADGQKTFTMKLLSNDGYGIPNDVKQFLQGGVDAIDNISRDILTGAGGVDSLLEETEKLAAGERLGQGNFGSISTFSGKQIDNPSLKNAFRVADSLLPNGNVINFCNNLSNNQPTNAIIIGQRENRNDATYSIFSGGDVNSGETSRFIIRRDNSRTKGIIAVLGYKSSEDNVRLSNNSNRGDVDVDASFSNTDLVADSRLPARNSVFFYRKIEFNANETEKEIRIPTNNIGFINSSTEKVTFTVGVFRASDDINFNSEYPGDNTPTTANSLNVAKGNILFSIPQQPISLGIPPIVSPTITISGNTTISGRECIPSILITSQPPASILAVDSDTVPLAVVARVTTAGYTLNYQWQKSKSSLSGWQNITDGSYTVTVSSTTQVYGVIASGFTTTGSSYTFMGYIDTPTTVTTTYNYSGSTSPTLSISPVSFYANDNEYYRCIISSQNLPQQISTSSLLRVNKDGAYTPPDALPPGNVIDNPNNTEPSINPPVSSGVLCEPFIPTPEEVIPVPEVVPSGTVITNPGNTGDITTPTQIIGVPAPEQGPIIAPVIVGPDGGVNSITLPDNLPRFALPPIVSIIGPGAGATAKAEIDEDGNLTQILVKSRGFGYTPNNTRNLCAILESIELISSGNYYQVAPTVYVDGNSSIAKAEINSSGKVIGISIVNPQDKVYETIPRIEVFGGEGIGCVARAIIRYVDCDKVGDEYTKVLNRYKPLTREPVSVVDCP